MAEAIQAPRFASRLILWMTLIAGLQGVLWITGYKQSALREAVEQGAAEAERRAVGETDEETIREKIRTQQETLPFWTALAAIGDFLMQPLLLACRAALAATLFSALAALFGRAVRFDLAMAECVGCQLFWVLEVAAGVFLTLVLRQGTVDTSLVLLLPPGSYSIITWTLLRQFGFFTILGWLAMAWRARQREETSLSAAIAVCVLLALMEMILRGSVALLIGAQMRLALPTG
jgi:hypothetical protein